MRSLPAHAGSDPLDIGYFRGAEPPDVRRAKPPLIFLRERPAGRRPQSPGCHDAGHKQQPPNAKHFPHRPLQIDRRCGRHPGGSPPWNRCMIVIWILSVSTRRDRRALLLLSCAAPVPEQEPLRSRAATKPASGNETVPPMPRVTGAAMRHSGFFYRWSSLKSIVVLCAERSQTTGGRSPISAFATSLRNGDRCARPCRRR